jgi:hypothetical protein
MDIHAQKTKKQRVLPQKEDSSPSTAYAACVTSAFSLVYLAFFCFGMVSGC